MKLSKSKLALAKVINENGGWVYGAKWSAQDKRHREKINVVAFYMKGKPWHNGGDFWRGNDVHGEKIYANELIRNWHQACLSREEYYQAYPKADADGWIEWNGGECPVDDELRIDVKTRDGEVDSGDKAFYWNWSHDDVCCKSSRQIVAYRLHKPEVKPELCESVMRSIPEPEAKPTIEQLAQDYRNKLEFANRKQQEADDAKAAADAALVELELAGEALGLLIGIAKPEPELVIADWRDLQIGDIIEYVDGGIKDKIGMTGPVVEFAPEATDGLFVRLKCDNGPNKGRLGWPKEWRFIRRP